MNTYIFHTIPSGIIKDFPPGHSSELCAWYHLVDLLQPTPPEETEMLFSKWREQMSTVCPYIINHPLKNLTRMTAHKLSRLQSVAEGLFDYDPKTMGLIREFLSHSAYQTFGEFYLNDQKERLILEGTAKATNELMVDLFKKFHIDPEELYKKSQRKDPLWQPGIPWKDLTIQSKHPILRVLMRQLAIEKYGLKKSSWKPTKKISVLIQELQQKGPLLVTGHLGKHSYKNSAVKLKTEIEGQPLYGWKKNAPKTELLFGAILIVGAKKGNAEHVYYKDPFDLNKTYIISYNSLTERIADLAGIIRQEQPYEIGYAVHK